MGLDCLYGLIFVAEFDMVLALLYFCGEVSVNFAVHLPQLFQNFFYRIP